MTAQCQITARKAAGAELGFFERWLTLWVFLSIVNSSKAWYERGARI